MCRTVRWAQHLVRPGAGERPAWYIHARMSITDRERVGRVLDLLDAIRPRLRTSGAAATSDDVRVLLGETLDVMGRLVEDRYAQRDAATHVHELIGIRNRWAHRQPVDRSDAIRAADTVVRLFAILELPTASAEAMKTRLLDSEPAATNRAMGANGDRDEGGKTVAMIACTKQKQTRAVAAIEMYGPSPLFRRCVETARADKLPIVIFSTKYGLIPARQVIEPYEVNLKDMSPADREDLGARVDEQVGRLVSAGVSEVVLFAGAEHRRLVEGKLRKRGVDVSTHPAWKAITREVFG